MAEFLPAGTATDVGTVALPLLLERITDTPPIGATVPKVTVPVETPPPTTDVGFKTSDVTTGGLMVNDALTLTLFRLAVTVATA